MRNDRKGAPCETCFNCWGTVGGYVRCDAVPAPEWTPENPIHRILLVIRPDECPLYEEEDDWGKIPEGPPKSGSDRS